MCPYAPSFPIPAKEAHMGTPYTVCQPLCQVSCSGAPQGRVLFTDWHHAEQHMQYSIYTFYAVLLILSCITMSAFSFSSTSSCHLQPAAPSPARTASHAYTATPTTHVLIRGVLTTHSALLDGIHHFLGGVLFFISRCLTRSAIYRNPNI
jgi:hypothetical protein